MTDPNNVLYQRKLKHIVQFYLIIFKDILQSTKIQATFNSYVTVTMTKNNVLALIILSQ